MLKRVGNDEQRAATWLCRCDCGTERVVRGYSLRYGHTKSCGCLSSDQVAERNWKHGGSHTKLYRVWDSMRKRCTNINEPAYKNYGGRGIAVCNEWIMSFEEFRDWALSHGYQDGLSIDRIDNDGGYCPENCRWVDVKTQCNNRRSNHMIEFSGERHTISEWADLRGMKSNTLEYRLKSGWPIEKALTEKVRLRRWRKKPENAVK